jgi:hypothetical protein
MRIVGDEIFWRAVKIGEVAAPATRDQDFLSRLFCAFYHCDMASTFTGFDGAHQSGGACSQNQNVVFVGGHRVAQA